jgi:hypothetical protein
MASTGHDHIARTIVWSGTPGASRTTDIAVVLIERAGSQPNALSGSDATDAVDNHLDLHAGPVA